MDTNTAVAFILAEFAKKPKRSTVPHRVKIKATGEYLSTGRIKKTIWQSKKDAKAAVRIAIHQILGTLHTPPYGKDRELVISEVIEAELEFVPFKES